MWEITGIPLFISYKIFDFVYLYSVCKFVQIAWRWPYTMAETYHNRERMKIKRIDVHTSSLIMYTLSLNHNGDASIKISLLCDAWPRIEDSRCDSMPCKCSQVYILVCQPLHWCRRLDPISDDYYRLCQFRCHWHWAPAKQYELGGWSVLDLVL
jgi:hypothetical protein